MEYDKPLRAKQTQEVGQQAGQLRMLISPLLDSAFHWAFDICPHAISMDIGEELIGLLLLTCMWLFLFKMLFCTGPG